MIFRPRKGLGCRSGLIIRYCDRLVVSEFVIVVLRLFEKVTVYDAVLDSIWRIVLPIGVLSEMVVSMVLMM